MKLYEISNNTNKTDLKKCFLLKTVMFQYRKKKLQFYGILKLAGSLRFRINDQSSRIRTTRCECRCSRVKLKEYENMENNLNLSNTWKNVKSKDRNVIYHYEIAWNSLENICKDVGKILYLRKNCEYRTNY